MTRAVQEDSKVPRFLGAAVAAAFSCGGYAIAQLGGGWSVVGWTIVVIFGLGALGALVGPSPSTPYEEANPDPRDVPPIAELHALVQSPVIKRRVSDFMELAEIMTVTAIRLGVDDAFSASGSTSRRAVTPGQASRGSLAFLLMAKAYGRRSLSPSDAVFLFSATGDFSEAAATPEIAWRFMRFADWSEMASSGFDIDDFIEFFDESKAYHRAAGDRRISEEGKELLLRLVANFVQPWPSGPTGSNSQLATRPKVRNLTRAHVEKSDFA